MNSCTAEAVTVANGVESLPELAHAGHWGELETILLVEDEAFVRKAASEALESVGYRMLIAGSASEALDACRDAFLPVDLLLSDVVMPGMSGCELAQEFRRLSPRARVLLMSGYEQKIHGHDQSLPAEKFLTKPFSISTLLSRVREALDASPVDSETQA